MKDAVNCAIFRHAAFAATGELVSPHLPRDAMDQLIRANQIRGCGQPFRLLDFEGGKKAEKCDWV